MMSNVVAHFTFIQFVSEKLGDWKARLDEAGERELEIADEEEEEAEGRRHIPEGL